jgi:hypothetical protein
MDIKKILADLKDQHERIKKAIAALEELAPESTPQSGRLFKAKSAPSEYVVKRRRSSTAARKRLSPKMKMRFAKKKGDGDWGGPLKKKA